MYLTPLQAVHNAQLYQIGDVTVDPSAVIGIGVILQAAPNCRIVIGAGACLGMGTILNACEGSIEIEPGAVLGAGVLMVGQGKVGANASIGSVTTIFNASIKPMQVLAAGSVMGDIQAKVAKPQMNPPQNEINNTSKTPEVSPVEPGNSPIQNQSPPSSQSDRSVNPVNPSDSPKAPIQSQQSPSFQSDRVENQDELPVATDHTDHQEDPPTTESSSTANSTSELSDEPLENGIDAGETTPGSPIYGQVYISRMLGTIFPQGKSINRRPHNHHQ